MGSPVEFDLTISNDTVAGQSVQERIVGHMEELGYSSKDLFGVRLALEEALINAIKHGNRMNPQKKVRVECSITEQRLRVAITDEGEGFKPEDVPDPTTDENLERPCGRGIMLMKAFLSLIEFQNGGRTVVMERSRTSEEES